MDQPYSHRSCTAAALVASSLRSFRLKARIATQIVSLFPFHQFCLWVANPLCSSLLAIVEAPDCLHALNFSLSDRLEGHRWGDLLLLDALVHSRHASLLHSEEYDQVPKHWLSQRCHCFLYRELHSSLIERQMANRQYSA